MPTSAYQIEISKRDQQIAGLLQRNQELEQENKELEQENKRLKELLHNKGKSKDSKKPEFKIDYSVKQNQGKRKPRHKSTGRRRPKQKLNLVSGEEAVYPSTVKQECCIAKRQQYAWRILSGKAQYVCYTLYGLESDQDLPKVPGLRNSRSEYGLEIILIVAFLHYWIGISSNRSIKTFWMSSMTSINRPSVFKKTDD